MREGRSVAAVPAALLPWVSEISVSTHDGAPRTWTEAPDPAVTLAIRWSGDGASDVVVAGPRRRALHYTVRPGPSCVQLRLRPGRVPPVVDPVREIVDRLVPLHGDVPTLVEMLAAGDGDDRGRSELVEDATQLLAQGASVGSVARQLHVSERHLRNVFHQTIGLSPKQYARIRRVRVAAAAVGHRDLAEVAATAGYYDQAHMTTEFRRLMGITPGAFAAGRRPRPAPCDHRPAEGTGGAGRSSGGGGPAVGDLLHAMSGVAAALQARPDRPAG